MKALVITSCTAKKRFETVNDLNQNDLQHLDTCDKLSNLPSCKAIDMYTGAQHLLLKEGYESHKDILDLVIISAGYGLIDSDKIIYPYNVSFNDMSDSEISNWSNYLNITEDLNKKIKEYDICFFLLGSNYLKSIDFSKINFRDNQKLIFFLSSTAKKSLIGVKNYIIINSGKQEAIDYSYGIIGLKGYLFKLLCNELNDNILNKIYTNPNLVNDIIVKYKYQKSNSEIKSEVKKVNLF